MVPTGVDIGRLPEKLPLPQYFSEKNPLHLGFIGTLGEIKGPQVVLDALSLLNGNGRKVIFEIYGNLLQKELLSHEVAHTQQQNNGQSAKIQRRGGDDDFNVPVQTKFYRNIGDKDPFLIAVEYGIKALQPLFWGDRFFSPPKTP